MKIIICGAGQVGWQIARQLSSERHDVVLIDQDERLIQQANDALDVQGIVGHASHAQAPDQFPTAPVPAAEKLLARIGWDSDSTVAYP